MIFDEFLNKLEKRPQKNSAYNPYKQKKLVQNLENYLEVLYKEYFDGVMLVAEAPGYSGCAITGIPFTTVKILQDKPHEILNQNYFLGQQYSDISGQVIWEYLSQKKKIPLLWNAFPFHPYQKYKKFSNRKPNSAEINEGVWYIKQLVNIFKPKIIAGIGRVGENSLCNIYPNKEIEYIRHPSHGGKKEFIAGMDLLYNSIKGNE